MSSVRLPDGHHGGDRRNAPSRSRSQSQSSRQRKRHHRSVSEQRAELEEEDGEVEGAMGEYGRVSGPPEALVQEGPPGLGESMLHNAEAGESHHRHHVDRDDWTGADDAGEDTPLLSRATSQGRSDHHRKPWYRRPSPAFLLPGALVLAAAMAMIIAPKLEIYNQLVCRALSDPPALPRDNSNNTVGGGSPGPRLPDRVLAATSPLPIVDLPLGPAPPFTWDVIFAEDPEIRARANDWADRCRRSPKVSSSVARLNTLLTLTGGLLSSLTTGFWGGVSDRYGRKVILVLSLLGFFINDIVFLVTVMFAPRLPYQFLVLGPFAEGLVGGWAAASAGVNAYISDCTPTGSRATIFSTVFGVVMGGMALGPTIGGLVIKANGGNVLTPFYVSALTHASFAIGSCFILPESLGPTQANEAKLREHERKLKEAEEEAKEDAKAKEEGWSLARRVWVRVKRTLANVFGFLRPIGLLLPRKGGFEGVDLTRTGAKSGANARDWNLTIIAVAYALYVLMFGVYGPKMQYTMIKFDWGPVENGYYLTIMGASRVVALLVVLPIFIRLVKPPTPATAVPIRSAVEEEEVAQAAAHENGSSTRNGKSKTSAIVEEAQRRQEAEERHAKHVRLLHDSHFDLKLARYSMLIDAFCYLLLIFNTSPITFLVPSVLQSLGGGASPAVQSLALSLAPPHHAGKILASLSVLSSTMSSVLGPLLFGLVFASTVGTFAETIFVLGTAVFGLSSVFLLLVRLKRQEPTSSGGASTEEESVGVQRGRSRSPRHLRNTSQISTRNGYESDDPLKGASASAFVLHRGVRDDGHHQESAS